MFANTFGMNTFGTDIPTNNRNSHGNNNHNNDMNLVQHSRAIANPTVRNILNNPKVQAVLPDIQKLIRLGVDLLQLPIGGGEFGDGSGSRFGGDGLNFGGGSDGGGFGGGSGFGGGRGSRTIYSSTTWCSSNETTHGMYAHYAVYM